MSGIAGLARLRIGHTYLTQRYLLTRDPQPYCDRLLGAAHRAAPVGYPKAEVPLAFCLCQLEGREEILC
ncbi:hypothetical protein E2C01_034922 [Portunus trituberculatus]|uniref:Uncharacterized protein n=1 Tax=Portunus trituberculatus TaxID=210409 RepID=A0A5B7FA31_PORTR|nr:hypothetical protein [Portunus trituberculatus]